MRRPTRLFLVGGLGVVASVLLIGGSILLLKIDEPDESVILNTLGEDLPVFWTIKSAKISASSESEVEDSMIFKQRFEAIVSPREELFVAAPKSETIGPFMVISPKSASSEEYTLHGVAASTLSLEKWSTKIVLENSVNDLGQPRSAFDGPTLLTGSEEAIRVAMELKAVRELAARVRSVGAANVQTQVDGAAATPRSP